MKTIPPAFATEAALCAAFSSCLPPEWTAYNETAGWDILLVHRHGFQIGIEAKLTLNAKVLSQAIDGRWCGGCGPDYRAVLVGKVVAENAHIARELGLTVITLRHQAPRYRAYEWQGPEIPRYHINPTLPCFAELADVPHEALQIPSWMGREDWLDEAPTERLRLPEYLPDVPAGCPSPLTLSEWKIRAMRICVWVERHSTITRAQFKALGVDPSRWCNGHWMTQAPARGEWKAAAGFPANQFRREHPSIFAKIEADYLVWAVKAGLALPQAATPEVTA